MVKDTVFDIRYNMMTDRDNPHRKSVEFLQPAKKLPVIPCKNRETGVRPSGNYAG